LNNSASRGISRGVAAADQAQSDDLRMTAEIRKNGRCAKSLPILPSNVRIITIDGATHTP
jgi:hypothetical protein